MMERPVLVELLPPCNAACPAGEDIQGWMNAASTRDYERAWKALVRNNPMPAVMGRVCYHPCESGCNRGPFDESVNIHAVERFLGDEAIGKGWRFEAPAPATGQHVLIVGAGPAGLSAAYHLRRLGHDVSIREAASRAGGMMRYGIPRYRLPRNILDAEIARIEAFGVDIQLDARVDDVAAIRGFDAVFLAVGAQISKRTQIPGLDALTMLQELESGVTPALGRRVLVYGGGNTALDVARTAKRLGAAETLIIYRRTREKMPAQKFEVEEALEEGVAFQWLSVIRETHPDSLIIEKMRLDENGFPKPTGEFESIAPGTLIHALGQDPDLGLLNKAGGVLEVDEHMMTGRPGVFAGGDMIPGERTVAVAIGHGKKAAHDIDAYLRGEIYRAAPRRKLAALDRLNFRHYEHAARAKQPLLDPARRVISFDEVWGGLDEAAAAFEARRCLSCGNCFECDNCKKICPGDAVLKLGPGKRFQFDYENCDGCGLCAEECPCGAIEMQVH